MASSSELTYRGHDAQPQHAGAFAAAETKQPRSNKPVASLSRSLRYVLGEQRLAFALVGMALATVLFLLLAPTTTTTTVPSTSSSVAHLAAVGLVSRQYSGAAAYGQQQSGRLLAGGRVPLGLKRKDYAQKRETATRKKDGEKDVGLIDCSEYRGCCGSCAFTSSCQGSSDEE